MVYEEDVVHWAIGGGVLLPLAIRLATKALSLNTLTVAVPTACRKAYRESFLLLAARLTVEISYLQPLAVTIKPSVCRYTLDTFSRVRICENMSIYSS